MLLFRKNKKREYRCSLCNQKLLNEFYGCKAYADIPLYLIDFYDMHESKCIWCGLEFYYLVKNRRI